MVLRRILVVDDDPMNIDVVRESLGDEHLLASACSGAEALAMVASFRPDLVLLDIMMPGMDGYEVCRRLRSEKRYLFTKVILVSARARLADRLAGYQAGADDYLTKPFDCDELKAKIDVFLRLKRAEELDRLKEDLLRLLAHETLTPLNAVLGGAQLLLRRPELAAEARQLVELVRDGGERLRDFISKTLLLSELKTGGLSSKSPASLAERARRAVNSCQPAAEKKHVKLAVQVEEAAVCEADWSRVEPVLGYLLDNALKFSPVGGAVQVLVRRDGEFCLLRVADQGPGIKSEWLDRIFDEFAVKDIMHHGQGQGLSLAIGRLVAELHGGALEVQSDEGRGAAFTLRLPAASRV